MTDPTSELLAVAEEMLERANTGELIGPGWVAHQAARIRAAIKKPSDPEILREIPGHQRYLASTLGRIFSKRKVGWCEMAYNKCTEYLSVSLSTENTHGNSNVHSLVLLTFTGPRPDGMEARHLNGDPYDNRLSNLVWGTGVENCRDTALHGRGPIGARNPMAKLTEADVLEIRRLKATGLSYGKIAKMFGVACSTANEAGRGTKWKHVR